MHVFFFFFFFFFFFVVVVVVLFFGFFFCCCFFTIISTLAADLTGPVNDTRTGTDMIRIVRDRNDHNQTEISSKIREEKCQSRTYTKRTYRKPIAM